MPSHRTDDVTYMTKVVFPTPDKLSAARLNRNPVNYGFSEPAAERWFSR
jgi:hypothetical protein